MQTPTINKYFPLLCVIQTCAKSFTASAVTTEQYSLKTYYEIKRICKELNIVPDVIAQAPKHLIEIAYNKVDYVDFGNYLTVDQIKREPTLVRWPRSPELLYTLMLISPDYPTRENPIYKEWQYWLVTNSLGGDLELAETMTEYSPPTEIPGNEPCRMIFLAFTQRTEHIVNFTEPRHSKEPAIFL
ncbi:protein D1 isoform X2 [Bemisia tabaci]|uniref:protein D1 isoform X2 n=1 Tax=Bemisia tabaci TaxID=7038 RepID=UPI0008F9D5ED|nr:PREDICTED: protein D1-like isoform X2 [Bemisia tabaci]